MKIKLNPDTEIVNTIKEGLKKTGGYCPCRREKTDDTKCIVPASPFRFCISHQRACLRL